MMRSLPPSIGTRAPVVFAKSDPAMAATSSATTQKLHHHHRRRVVERDHPREVPSGDRRVRFERFTLEKIAAQAERPALAYTPQVGHRLLDRT